jgi:hypothetical protein
MRYLGHPLPSEHPETRRKMVVAKRNNIESRIVNLEQALFEYLRENN